MSDPGQTAALEAWLDALPARHAAALRRPEFLKAIRALSARYVEKRSTLSDRSPIDSAGKRAAFAGFYAPLHFLTARRIVGALGLLSETLDTVIDLGCGTGTAGLAWATALQSRPTIVGIDKNAWALGEARRNWDDLGVRGRAVRGDFVAEIERLATAPTGRADRARAGIMLGWSLNELDARARLRAERAITTLASQGARILIIEPIARRLVPWWDDVAIRAIAAGARSDEWRFDDPLPPRLAALDRDAGFSRDALTARSIAWR